MTCTGRSLFSGYGSKILLFGSGVLVSVTGFLGVSFADVVTVGDIEFELKQADGSYQNQYMCGGTASFILVIKNTDTSSAQNTPIALAISPATHGFGDAYNALGTLGCTPTAGSNQTSCTADLSAAPEGDSEYCVADLSEDLIRTPPEPEGDDSYRGMEFFEIEFADCGCENNGIETVTITATIDGTPTDIHFDLIKPFCDCPGAILNTSTVGLVGEVCDYDINQTTIEGQIFMSNPAIGECACVPYDQCGNDNASAVGDECASSVCFDDTQIGYPDAGNTNFVDAVCCHVTGFDSGGPCTPSSSFTVGSTNREIGGGGTDVDIYLENMEAFYLDDQTCSESSVTPLSCFDGTAFVDVDYTIYPGSTNVYTNETCECAALYTVEDAVCPDNPNNIVGAPCALNGGTGGGPADMLATWELLGDSCICSVPEDLCDAASMKSLCDAQGLIRSYDISPTECGSCVELVCVDEPACASVFWELSTDISVDDPGPHIIGSEVQYTVELSYLSTGTAEGLDQAEVQIMLPETLQYSGGTFFATPSGGALEIYDGADNNTLLVSESNLQNGDLITYTFRATIIATGDNYVTQVSAFTPDMTGPEGCCEDTPVHQGICSVDSCGGVPGGRDPVSGVSVDDQPLLSPDDAGVSDNSDCALDLIVVESFDLDVAKTVLSGDAFTGDETYYASYIQDGYVSDGDWVQYEISVINNGPYPVEDFLIDDILPTGGAIFDRDLDRGDFNLLYGPLGVGEEISGTISVEYLSLSGIVTVGDEICNVAYATGGNPVVEGIPVVGLEDRQLGNNDDDACLIYTGSCIRDCAGEIIEDPAINQGLFISSTNDIVQGYVSCHSQGTCGVSDEIPEFEEVLFEYFSGTQSLSLDLSSQVILEVGPYGNITFDASSSDITSVNILLDSLNTDFDVAEITSYTIQTIAGASSLDPSCTNTSLVPGGTSMAVGTNDDFDGDCLANDQDPDADNDGLGYNDPLPVGGSVLIISYMFREGQHWVSCDIETPCDPEGLHIVYALNNTGWRLSTDMDISDYSRLPEGEIIEYGSGEEISTKINYSVTECDLCEEPLTRGTTSGGGTATAGNSDAGNSSATAGNSSAGDSSSGTSSAGNSTTGNSSAGSASAGNSSAGSSSGGDSSAGSSTAGDDGDGESFCQYISPPGGTIVAGASQSFGCLGAGQTIELSINGNVVDRDVLDDYRYQSTYFNPQFILPGSYAVACHIDGETSDGCETSIQVVACADDNECGSGLCSDTGTCAYECIEITPDTGDLTGGGFISYYCAGVGTVYDLIVDGAVVDTVIQTQEDYAVLGHYFDSVGDHTITCEIDGVSSLTCEGAMTVTSCVDDSDCNGGSCDTISGVCDYVRDLQINKELISIGTSFAPGDTVSYEITVVNSGSNIVGHDVEISDILPNGFELLPFWTVSLNATLSGAPTPGTTTPMWTLLTLAPGQIVTIQYDALIGTSAVAPYINQASIIDPDGQTESIPHLAGACDTSVSHNPIAGDLAVNGTNNIDCVELPLLCVYDNVCNADCPATGTGCDPDCATCSDCTQNNICNPSCPANGDGCDLDCATCSDNDCAEDGVCNATCPSSGDGCDSDCTTCNDCSTNNECNENCPATGAGCDLDCPTCDLCEQDNICNPNCPATGTGCDPDCTTCVDCTENNICNSSCPSSGDGCDPDCETCNDSNCTEDNVCNALCPATGTGCDPDCATCDSCGLDNVCDSSCESDPDCENCTQDNTCNPNCPASGDGCDPDCETCGANCNADGVCPNVCPPNAICVPVCPPSGPGCDPDCASCHDCSFDLMCNDNCPLSGAGCDLDCATCDTCAEDGVCDSSCPSDGAGCDPDCTTCQGCSDDEVCNDSCPSTGIGCDPDCATCQNCSDDGVCNLECPGAGNGCDPDCQTCTGGQSNGATFGGGGGGTTNSRNSSGGSTGGSSGGSVSAGSSTGVSAGTTSSGNSEGNTGGESSGTASAGSSTSGSTGSSSNPYDGETPIRVVEILDTQDEVDDLLLGDIEDLRGDIIGTNIQERNNLMPVTFDMPEQLQTTGVDP